MDCYGFRGNALKWLQSYFQNRRQRVHLNGLYSNPEQKVVFLKDQFLVTFFVFFLC